MSGLKIIRPTITRPITMKVGRYGKLRRVAEIHLHESRGADSRRAVFSFYEDGGQAYGTDVRLHEAEAIELAEAILAMFKG